jgi:hypothetical protein
MISVFFYTSNHLQNRTWGRELIVDDICGKAFVSCEIQYHLKGDGTRSAIYSKKSELIPIKIGIKSNSGGQTITGKNTGVDLLRRDRFGVRILELSNVEVSRDESKMIVMDLL